MLFLGIDPSLTGSGLTILDDSYSIKMMKKLSTPTVGVERLYHLQLKFEESLNKYYNDIHFVCIESAAFRESGRLWSMGQWAGIFYLDLYRNGIPFLEVAPLQLKKYVSSVGKNQGKEVVMLDIFKNFNEEIRDSDIADAYVLARIARDYHYVYRRENKNKYLKKYQQDVLSKLNKENSSKKILL